MHFDANCEAVKLPEYARFGVSVVFDALLRVERLHSLK